MAGRFSIEAVFKGKDHMSRVLGKIQTRFDRFERAATGSLRSVDRAFKSVHSGIKRSAVVVAAAAGAAGAGIMNVVKSGAEFEQAISAVGAVSLMTRDQIADLEARARELGATTQFTATEVAGAMELMGRAGFTNAEILSGIEGILAAAAAEGEEIAVVAGHVSDALKGMGLATSESTRVADVLALASARTNSSISSLGESLSQVSSKARQMNIPFEQVVASVALLQDVGLDASTAGTAMKAMLTKLTKPSKLVAGDMRRLGLSTKSFKDAKGNMLPLEQVLQKLVGATKKAGGNFDQSAFLARMFGLETETAAMNMLKLFDEGKIQGLTKELEGAAGSAQKMADIRTDNLLGDWEKFTGAIDSVKLSLFDLEGGPLRDTVKMMTAWVEQNQKLILGKVADFLKGVRDNLPAIVTWLERIGTALVVFYTLAAAIKVAMVALATYRGAVVVAKAAMAVFNAVMAANPFVLLAAAVVAAGIAVYVFREEIGAFFGYLFDRARDALMAFAEFGLGLVALIFPIDALVAAWDLVDSLIGTAFEGIVAAMSATYAAVLAVWTPIVEFFAGIWDAIADSFTGALGWVFDKLGAVVDKITGAVSSTRNLGRSAMERIAAGDDADGGAPVTSQVVTPQDRVARSVSESRSESSEKVEVQIKAPPGAAEVKRGRKPAKGASIKLNPSGGY